MTGRVRVLVWHRAVGAGERGAVQAAYHAISRDLAGTPGLLRNELLHSPRDPEVFVVASEWTDLASFRAWEQGPTHRTSTSRLRPFRDQRREPPFEILEVMAEY